MKKRGKNFTETKARSLVKAILYRIFIVALDFTAIYLFTGKITIAVLFVIISNIYTTIGYYFYERIWNRIKWGRKN